MESIKVYVNRQIDGYTFSILPSMRQLVRSCSPNFRPANAIFVAYDMRSEYEINYSIYPALLGVNNQSDLIEKIDEIRFVDTKTGEQLHSQKITA